MKLNEIPTPETDATDDRQTERSGGAAYLNMRHQSRDLERRLTIAREALEIARVGMSCVGVPNAAEREVLNNAFDHVCEALKQTAP